MADSQRECHIELAGFDDLARLACSYREYPRRVYSFELDGRRVVATVINLSNTLAVLYAQLPRTGRYVSYKIDAGREVCDVTDSASNSASCAPIIHLKSKLTRLEAAASADEISDVFHPVELGDLGSLARLTYDPDFLDSPNLTLYAVPVGGRWVLGYLIYIEMDQPHYEFYYLGLDAEPNSRFVRYKADRAADPEFTDRVEHGYTYMPVVKIKKAHQIFGFNRQSVA